VIRAAELIQLKRDGEELSETEMSGLVLGYARGEVPDYQMAAFCMAVYFRGLSSRETFALTDAMVRSGETLDLGAALGRTVLDKHSTGGVGDKTSLAVGPIIAACGVPLGKMSGRGLGHTGGTLDKLESIPGFRVELSTGEFVAQLREVGLAIVGQSAQLVPADKLLYRLRDVTATVDQRSLIAASIMSKKLAGGAQAIVLDIKVGDGAFMKTLDEARALAESMLALAGRAGRRVVCLLTDMDQPLGAAVGNALEVREARATLRGQGPDDLRELVYDACSELLVLSDLGVDATEARSRVERAVADGSAEAAWRRWIAAQGGDSDERALPEAPVVVELTAPESGTITRLGAARVGMTALHLGAGRARSDEGIDHAVGVVCRRKRGEKVEKGEVLAEVHARDEGAARRALAELATAFTLGDGPVAPRPILLEVVA
jgi:pyrimidine-nucleoside phosphorylase